MQYYSQVQFNDRWVLLTDGGYRWRDNFGESSQYIFRTGIGYKIKPSIRVASGFAHLGFFLSEKIVRIENRPYQEIQLRNKIGKMELNQRFRLEERFFHLKQSIQIEDPNTFNFRYRYSILFNFRLFHLSKSNPEQYVSVKVGDEIFLNSGENIVYNRFDQNRMIVSPTININENLAVSLTWNYQYASTPVKDFFISSNVYWLQINHKIDLKKKRKTH